jgi:hypothetical protein
MNWVKGLVNQIENEQMDAVQLWQLLRQQNHKAFGQHVDKHTDSIAFGDKYNCGYANFEHETGKLIIHEYSPYWNPGEDVAELYKYQNPSDIYRRINFLPRRLWTKYQDMRGALLPVCDLFINHDTVDMDYDAKPDYTRATYRIDPDTYAIRNIDAIYTAESIDDEVLNEVLNMYNNMKAVTVKLSLKQARQIIENWTVNFGNHKLILLSIPSGTDDPNGGAFPYLIEKTLNYRYEKIHENDEDDC